MRIRKEIGSEFWDVPMSSAKNSVFPVDTKWFVSGRSALGFIISDIKLRQAFNTVAVPSWCCDSMIEPFLKEGIEVVFYSVYVENGELVQDVSEATRCDAILVMDYFGYASAQDYSSFPGIVIRDLTHSLFSEKYRDADYYFGSLRKWCGIWTGGFAWREASWLSKNSIKAPDVNYLNLREQAMNEKAKYIYALQDGKEYLAKFSQAEEMLERMSDIQYAAERDIYCAERIDVTSIKTARRKNAEVLLEHFASIAIFKEINDKACPLFVPILVADGRRDDLRKFLIQNEIYCPVHWPITPLHKTNEKTKRLYAEELSIICDQRYTVNDMQKICQAVKYFLGE